ncbi:efflux RND transporter periplasmic adaptor subunit [Streptomyces niveus]|uniref:efflux RND transporter periplasmic adaptor subunit n=1 Tax=Streptomyces niveus TaxID=193462 RepID=UPI000687AE4C|nr:peptidoglycan-binding protein [Streptomyces niveus]
MTDTAAESAPRGTVFTRRRRWVMGTAAAAALLTAAGVLAAETIRSPAQAVADAAPPPASLLTAPVEYRVLKDSVILRGTVTAEQSVEVSAEGGPEGTAVVTRLPVKAGGPVKAGQVLLEVSGRPVVALEGPLPMYRDLKPGGRGDDVAQLQSALASLGHSTAGDESGYFGRRTKAAVSALYESVGHTPLAARPEGGPTLEQAGDEVTAARRALEDLPDTAPSVQRTRATEDLAKAQERRDEIETTSGPMVPASELVFLKSFPGRVAGVNTRVGAKASGAAMVLSAGRLVVNGMLQPHQKGLVQPEQPVEILSESTGATASGTVTSVADVMETESTGPPGDGAADAATGDRGYPVVVKPAKALRSDFAGQDVRLTIEAASTGSRTLVVPVSAVSAGADGKTTVTVVTPDDGQRRVRVTTGTSGDGYVEVRPAPGQPLAEGARVVVGVRGAAGPGTRER